MGKLETMSWEKDGKVARVTLNRPQLLNAMNNQATFDLNASAAAKAPKRLAPKSLQLARSRLPAKRSAWGWGPRRFGDVE